jgi:hypothetical protein
LTTRRNGSAPATQVSNKSSNEPTRKTADPGFVDGQISLAMVSRLNPKGPRK